MATPTYDPKKAELYNKLRKSGISEDQAWTQAGITPAEEFNYVVNDSPYNNDGSKNLNRGEMGAHIFGGGTKTFTPYTAAEKAESDAYYKSLESSNFEQVDYPVKASSQPSTKTVTTYTSTSTEQVSGGGSTTIIAPQPLANDTSRAIQAQADAKTAELRQYLADNPVNANTTPEEKAARRAKVTEISNERGKLATAAEEAKTAGTPSETIVPNTTTNTSTTTYQTSSTNTPVQSVDGPDPATNQQSSAPVAPIYTAPSNNSAYSNTFYDQAVDRSKNLVAEREANEARLIEEQSKYSRQEQKRLEAEAAAAAAAGSPDAAEKAAAAKQYADEKAAIAADLDRNGRLLQETKLGLAENEARLAQVQADQNADPLGIKRTANAGADGQAPYTTPLNETTPDVYSAAPAADPFSVTPRSIEPGVENSSAADVSASQDSGLLTPEQSIERAQVSAPESVDAATFNANTNTSVLGAIGTPAPADVNPATDPGVKSPFGGAASNAAAAQNPEAAAAAYQQEQANQAAAMKLKAQEQAAIQAEFQTPASGDWRVRLRLAPSAKYLYMDDNNTLLKPLKASNGVVFPYMPTIQTTYNASYDSVELTHSNYRGQFYKSSYVGDVSITGVFTAQDTAEANYLLAVIHFFRSVTKMFYGAKDPLRGSPPPLVYLIGLGQYQFNNQPCVVKTFNYSMPNDCDYIRTKPNNYNTNLSGRSPKPQASTDPISSVINRLKNAALPQGAVPNVPAQGLLEMQSVTNIADSTYVPTKCEIQLTLMPIQTRSQQSQQFNMENFANGNLLKGGFW